jgi:hypothetical protein
VLLVQLEQRPHQASLLVQPGVVAYVIVIRVPAKEYKYIQVIKKAFQQSVHHATKFFLFIFF